MNMQEKDIVAHQAVNDDNIQHVSHPQKNVVDWLVNSDAIGHNRCAISFDGVLLDYRSLHARSNQIAHFLGSIGIGKGHCVGLCLDRSLDLIVSLLGILKSGAAYVPMDPSYPSSRLGVMAHEARLEASITQKSHATLLQDAPGQMYFLEDIEPVIERQPKSQPTVHIDGEDAAVIIFTSGSTGTPKGVQMPHRAISNLIAWQLARETFKPHARVLQYSTISFDVSFQEIATTFASGGTLYLISDEARKDPRRLLDVIQMNRIQRLFLPYVAMRGLVDAANITHQAPHHLKEIITAGEQLRIDDSMRTFFSNIGNASLDNQYGPSETHVITAKLLRGDPCQWPDLPSIGHPISNNDVFVMDENLNVLPDGYTGELYLHGCNVATGYIHQPAQTRRSFIRSTHNPTQIGTLYKSGDLGFRNAAGELELLGRADHQIKIRGHRVEPADINAIAESYSGVVSCFTRIIEYSGSAPRLASYYTQRHDVDPVDNQQLHAYLATLLPEHMVPDYLIAIDSIPYSPSGKVNLSALPAPKADTAHDNPDFDYQSRVESSVAEMWQEVIGIEKAPRNIGFFELGGDSLRAVQLFLKIQQQFGIDLPLSSLSHAPTVAAIAKLIQGEDEHSSLTGFRCLHMIQRGDDSVDPLFLIHGGAGNILIFDRLAQHLDPRLPVYGFQWSGWDGGAGQESIKSMAAAYKEELLRFKPMKSYRLGGHCVGGIIAIELARQLQADGYSVQSPIFVSDTPNLQSRHYCEWEPEDFPDIRERCENMLSRMDQQRVDSDERWPMPSLRKAHRNSWLAARLKKNISLLKVVRWLKELPDLAVFHFTRLENKAILLAGGHIAIDKRPYYSASALWSAINKHRSSKFDGDVVYFRSSAAFGRNMALKGWWDDVYMGFPELVEGEFEGHMVGFGHNEVIKHPYVAEVINKRLGLRS